jgi:putative ABC transport system permease protein
LAKRKLLFRFAVSNAFRRKGIAVFAILGAALGIALMTVLLSISQGMDKQMNNMMEEMAAGVAVYPAADPLGFMMPSSIGMPVEYADEISEIKIEGEEAVSRVYPQVTYFVATEDYNFGDPMGILMRGMDFEGDIEPDDPFHADNIVEGRSLTPGSVDEVIIGILAQKAARGGDYAQVGGTMELPVRGGSVPSNTVTVVGIFETGNTVYDFSLYTDLSTAHRLMPIIATDEANFISVEAADLDYVTYVSDTIVEMFQDRAVPVSATVATELLESFQEMMGTIDSFLWIVSLVAAIAGGISIFIVMLLSVIERTKEFGIVKASGWSNRNIITSVVVQSITISMLGAAIGLAIGYLGGQGIDAYIAMDIAAITWRLILFIAVFGIIAGVVGGLYPALRAARVSPIESMRAL